nr:immunoglobulin light chain junction region [Macaca mulatta]
DYYCYSTDSSANWVF